MIHISILRLSDFKLTYEFYYFLVKIAIKLSIQSKNLFNFSIDIQLTWNLNDLPSTLIKVYAEISSKGAAIKVISNTNPTTLTQKTTNFLKIIYSILKLKKFV